MTIDRSLLSQLRASSFNLSRFWRRLPAWIISGMIRKLGACFRNIFIYDIIHSDVYGVAQYGSHFYQYMTGLDE